MSATDRIREKVDFAKRMKAPGGATVSLDVAQAEALCDLADCARRVPDDGEVHGTTHDKFGHLICAYCRSPWPCPTSATRDALARLDGEGT